MGTLYIVATPIGNLQDLSFRAIYILTTVEIIACEDTRRTGLLLKYIKENLQRHSGNQASPEHPESLNVSQKGPEGDSGQDGYQTVTRQARMTSFESTSNPTLLSYFEGNEQNRIPQILNALRNGLDVALVSDAGTPKISDPGFKLVRECVRQGIKVESIPGPSSVISALVVSGSPTDKFLFLGYLPKKPGKRKNILNELKCFETLKQINPTIIFFEAPHRLVETLSNIKEIFGDIDIVIARELTKLHEEIRREKVTESIRHFNKVAPKGEFVILFHLSTSGVI